VRQSAIEAFGHQPESALPRASVSARRYGQWRAIATTEHWTFG